MARHDILEAYFEILSEWRGDSQMLKNFEFSRPYNPLADLTKMSHVLQEKFALSEANHANDMITQLKIWEDELGNRDQYLISREIYLLRKLQKHRNDVEARNLLRACRHQQQNLRKIRKMFRDHRDASIPDGQKAR